MLFPCILLFHLQSHYRRALALSGLGRIEESFIAYCVSICLDKRSENLTNSLRYDLSRVSRAFVLLLLAAEQTSNKNFRVE